MKYMTLFYSEILGKTKEEVVTLVIEAEVVPIEATAEMGEMALDAEALIDLQIDMVEMVTEMEECAVTVMTDLVETEETSIGLDLPEEAKWAVELAALEEADQEPGPVEDMIRTEALPETTKADHLMETGDSTAEETGQKIASMMAVHLI